MKKILCVVLAMLLAMFALAEAVPSKTVDDMIVFTTDAEGLVIEEVDDDKADAELEALAATTPEEYFGEDAIATAKAITGNDEATVCEFLAIRVANYTEDMGDVKANGTFPSTFDEGTKVAALIGFVNGEGFDWTAVEGTAVEDGSVEFVFPGDMLAKIQDEGALFALIK